MVSSSEHPQRHARRLATASTGLVLAMVATSGLLAPSGAPLEAAVAGGSVTEVKVRGEAGVPNDAEAAVLNITAANPAAPGHITAYPCDETRPTASTLNYQPGISAIANSTIVEIGNNGNVCLYAESRVDIIVDINGWFPAGSDLTPRNPNRLLDTRDTGTPSSRTTTQVQVANRAGVPNDAEAAVLNITAANPAAPGHITAYPCDETRPTASTLNYQPGISAIANSTIVEIGNNGNVCLYAESRVDIIVDINGWFPAGSDLTPRNPNRLLDTRDTGTPSSRTTTQVQVANRAGVPNDAEAAVLNITAANPAAPGHITAYPCDETRPTASTLNYQPGISAIANSTIVEIGNNGNVCLYAESRVDIIVDINGWFPAGSDLTPRNPNRLLDTRTGNTPDTGTPVPTVAQFVETFDGNGGLDRFRYGVYHREVGHREAGRSPQLSGWNNASHGGSWGGDHDLSCGSPDTQRTLRSDFERDTDGSNGWEPYVDFHVDELLYTCRDHMMTSMGDVAGYSIVWFSPDQVFDVVDSVEFEVNLTDLGTRQWWKVGVVSDSLFESSQSGGALGTRMPGHILSDVDAASVNGLGGSDRLIASWSGGASAGHPGGMKVGNNQLGGGVDARSDKKTRHPVMLIDNRNGTVTFNVAGVSRTANGSFPDCPCRVVFYDHNYTPTKSETGYPIGFTWHWDNILVR